MLKRLTQLLFDVIGVSMLKITFAVVILSFAVYKFHEIYFSIVTEVPDDEYDFIIVGGGTTGGVVASRLSENKNLRILVLEAGHQDGFDPLINIPLLQPFNRGGWNDWSFQTEKQENALNLKKNNSEEIILGKVLGGSSAINFQLYNRGSRYDYDKWESLGAKGWSFNDILPYFLKSESSNHVYPIDEEYHGKNGPLKVTHQKRVGLTEKFISAAKELGVKYIDHNGNKGNIFGVSTAQTTVHNGVIHSSSKTYLRPTVHLRRDQIHVVVNAHVTKILFRDDDNGKTRAYGAQYVKNGKTFVVRARKEIVLSAGAYGTPQLLMLSGIGPKDHLESMGIDVVQDLPGVGSNLQDHTFLPLYFHAANATDDDLITLKNIVYGVPQYILKRTGPLAVMGSAILTIPLPNTSFDQPNSESGIQYILLPTEISTTTFKNAVIASVRESVGYKDGVFTEGLETASRERNGIVTSMIVFAYLTTGKSRGTVRLQSSNPFDHPKIDHKLFSEPEDLEMMVKAIEWMMQMTETEAFKEIQAKFVVVHNQCSQEKEKSIKEYYRCLVKAETHLFHPSCTAKIGPQTDRMAVVDPQLRVYGIDGLRVADASVMPNIVSTPLQATCYMIGEKAADMIKAEL